MPNAKSTGLLTELKARPQTPDRDRLLDDAIKAGKFAESRRAHYAALYDTDPAATTRLIGKFEPGVVPTLGAGSPDGEGTGLLNELNRTADA